MVKKKEMEQALRNYFWCCESISEIPYPLQDIALKMGMDIEYRLRALGGELP